MGKQLPYTGIAFLNFCLMWALAVLAFQVPFTGSALTFAVAGFLYVPTATGLVVSAFMSSQFAAVFATAVLTILPAIQFSGLINPTSSLEGGAAFVSKIYPTTHFVTIARGTFSNGLGFAELAGSLMPVLIAIPVLIGVSALLLRKQEK